MKFPPKQKTPYVLDKPEHKRIFDKLSKFKDENLEKQDENLVKFLYSQLEDDWASPLEKFIDELLEKYGD